MTRLYGWAPRGQRLVDKVRHGHWKTATFLAALRNDRIDAPCLFDGPIRAAGARLLFLPKYLPDLNPIEQVFAKLKGLLRKAAARTYDAVSDATAKILEKFPPKECAAYLRNAGYA